MFAGDIQLSEQPNLGIWTISVSVSGKYNIKQTKRFEVHKYVSPQFSVHLETVDDFVRDNEILRVTVYGKYTFGRYVEGKAIVKIKDTVHAFEAQAKDIDNFKGTFNLNISNYLQHREIEVEATVIDKYTNISNTATKKIKQREQPYKILIPLDEIEFRNNRLYLIKAKVRYLNDTPVEDRKTPIFMEHGDKSYQSLLDEQGMASFIFDYENDQNNVFHYKNASTYLPNIFYDVKTSEDSLCNLKVKTRM